MAVEVGSKAPDFTLVNQDDESTVEEGVPAIGTAGRQRRDLPSIDES